MILSVDGIGQGLTFATTIAMIVSYGIGIKANIRSLFLSYQYLLPADWSPTIFQTQPIDA
jgi:hypothetical protein